VPGVCGIPFDNVEIVEMVDDIVVGMKEMSLLTKAQHLTTL